MIRVHAYSVDLQRRHHLSPHELRKKYCAVICCSTEAKIRATLEESVFPKTRVKIGSELAAFGLQFRGINFNIHRHQAPIESAIFE